MYNLQAFVGTAERAMIAQFKEYRILYKLLYHNTPYNHKEIRKNTDCDYS